MKAIHMVRVFGRELPVRSSASAEKVRMVESFVNTRLETIGSALKSGDAQLVLTLALLNTAEELLEMKDAVERNSTSDGRLKGIIEKLNTV